MRKYAIYCPEWKLLGQIKADGIGKAIELANAHFPDYRYISIQGRY